MCPLSVPKTAQPLLPAIVESVVVHAASLSTVTHLEELPVPVHGQPAFDFNAALWACVQRHAHAADAGRGGTGEVPTGGVDGAIENRASRDKVRTSNSRVRREPVQEHLSKSVTLFHEATRTGLRLLCGKTTLLTTLVTMFGLPHRGKEIP